MMSAKLCDKCGNHLMRVTGTDDYFCYNCQAFHGAKPGKPKRNKYGANRVQVDGIWFDSQMEADYYGQLKLRLKAGDIKWFNLQPRFPLLDGDTVIEYRADFTVCDKDGKATVIDVKGHETDSFKIKKKLLESQYDLKLQVVREV